MGSSASVLRTIRQFHLYFGVFITPALLFFALTGALQTFGLHESTRGSDYKPPHWAVVFGQIHKKQTAIVPERRPVPPNCPAEANTSPASSASSSPAITQSSHVYRPVAPETPPASPQSKRHPLPLKIFFLLVCLGLVTSTLTGVSMAYKYGRGLFVIAGLLLAGTLLPLVLIFV